MGNLGKLGVSGAVGILLGIAAILWIKPENAGGSALLIIICTALAIVVGAILKAILGR